MHTRLENADRSDLVPSRSDNEDTKNAVAPSGAGSETSMPDAAITSTAATELDRQALIQLDQAMQKVNVYFFREDGTVATTPSQSTDLSSVFGDKGDLFHPGQNGYRWDFVADVTGDGISDLVYSRAGDDDIRTIVGKADGTFDTRQMKVTDMSNVHGTWTGGGEGASYSTFLADVTHDGILDWVHGRSDGLSVYRGKGDGTFSERAITTAGLSTAGWPSGGDSYLGEIAGRPVWISYDDPTYTLNVYEFKDNGVLSTTPVVTDIGYVTPDDAPIYIPHNGLKSSSFLADVTGDKIPDLVFSVDNWWETLDGERYPIKGIAVMAGKNDETFDYAYTFTDMSELGSAGDWAGGTTKDVNGLHSTFLEDVNGDGKLDWIHTGTGHGVRAFLGNGDGTFSNTPVESAVAGRWSWGSTVVAGVGGANGITLGEQALVQLDQTAQKVNVYFFEPDGTVAATPSRSTDLSSVFGDEDDLFHPGQNGYRWDTIADVTGDGIADLVYSRAGDRDIRVILGKADGTFDTSQVKVTDMSHFGGTWTGGGEGSSYSTFLADVTHDGVLDWIHGTSGALSVYDGKGDGTFSERAITTTGFSNTNWATGGNSYLGKMGDRGTVWVSVDNVAHTISVYSFNSNGVLSLKPIVSDWHDITQKNGSTPAPHNDREGSSFFADVTGDNIPDLVYSVDRATNGIEVLTGHKDGTFSNAGIFTDLTKLGSVSNWAGDTTKDVNAMRSTFLEDVNGDSKLDWVHGSRAENSLEVFIGNGDGTFSNTPVTSSVIGNWSWGSTLIAHVGKDSVGTAADSTHLATDMNGHAGSIADVPHTSANHMEGTPLLVDGGINLDSMTLNSSVDYLATAHSDVSALMSEDIVGLLEKTDVHTLQLFAGADGHRETKPSDISWNSAHEQGLVNHSFGALDDFHFPMEEHAELLPA